MIAKHHRKQVCELMADGRERTSQDVQNAIGIKAGQARHHLVTLRKWGLVKAVHLGNGLPTIWRAK